MTVDAYEIAVLAEDYENKRQRWEMLAAANTYGLPPEDLMEQNIAYHQADAEMIQAFLRLQAAKRRESKAMTDIERRLRQFPWRGDNWDVRADKAMLEAADEIARQRAALQEIARQGGAEDTLAAIARHALEPKP